MRVVGLPSITKCNHAEISLLQYQRFRARDAASLLNVAFDLPGQPQQLVRLNYQTRAGVHSTQLHVVAVSWAR